MEDFRPAQQVHDLLRENKPISDTYNSLTVEEQRDVLQGMRMSGGAGQNLPDLVITGVDTNNDGAADVLLDVFDRKTGSDLYNRPGEKDNSTEAISARYLALHDGSSDQSPIFKTLSQKDLDNFIGTLNKQDYDPRALSEEQLKQVFDRLQDAGTAQPSEELPSGAQEKGLEDPDKQKDSGPAGSHELLDYAEQKFDALDKDKDGRVTTEDIDAYIQSHHDLPVEELKKLGSLKLTVDYLEEQNNDEWGDENSGFSRDDIKAARNPAAEGAFDKLTHIAGLTVEGAWEKIKNDPLQAVGEAAVGAALGAAIVAASPVIATTAAVAGLGYAAYETYNSVHELAPAIQTVWNSGDKSSAEYHQAEEKIKQNLGTALVDGAGVVTGAGAAAHAARDGAGHLLHRISRGHQDHPDAPEPHGEHSQPNRPAEDIEARTRNAVDNLDRKLVDGGSALNKTEAIDGFVSNVRKPAQDIDDAAQEYQKLQKARDENAASSHDDMSDEEYDKIEDRNAELVKQQEALKKRMEEDLKKVSDQLNERLKQEGLPPAEIEWDWNPLQPGHHSGGYDPGTGKIKVNVHDLLEGRNRDGQLVDSAEIVNAVYHEATHLTQDALLLRTMANDIARRDGSVSPDRVMEEFRRLRPDAKPDENFVRQMIETRHMVKPEEAARAAQIAEGNASYSRVRDHDTGGLNIAEYTSNYLEVEALHSGFSVRTALRSQAKPTG